MAKILIVGCGQLGTPLAHLLSEQGHQVTGLKRHPPKAADRQLRYLTADLAKPESLAGLPTDFDWVYFIVSPDGRGNVQSYQDVYGTGLTQLLGLFAKAASTPRWIFVSSTSVYGQTQGEWVDEASATQPTEPSSLLIKQAEQQVLAANPGNIVVRFSGIYGPGREYLLRLAQTTPAIQHTPPYYTNRIHQDDCVAVLAFLLARGLAGDSLASCYLASDDDPAPQWEVIAWIAAQMHCPTPTMRDLDGVTMNKRCRNQQLKALGYPFIYPSYKDGYKPMIDAYLAQAY